MIVGQCICDVKQEVKVSSTSSRFEVRFYLSHFEFAALKFHVKVVEICFMLHLSHPCRLISDLVVVIVSAAIGGIIFSCLGQPVSTTIFFSHFTANCMQVVLQTCWIICQVIVGYLLAGSIIGPGGLKFISEMVQVCFIHVVMDMLWLHLFDFMLYSTMSS